MRKLFLGSLLLLSLILGGSAQTARALTSAEAEAIIEALSLNSSKAAAIRALVTESVSSEEHLTPQTAQALIDALSLTGERAEVVRDMVGPNTSRGFTSQIAETLIQRLDLSEQHAQSLRALVNSNNTGTCYTYSRNLGVGMTGSDVMQLQRYLQSRQFMSLDTQATNYFGPMTRAAVVSYQRVEGISPTSGYVGTQTRARLNSSCGESVVTGPGWNTYVNSQSGFEFKYPDNWLATRNNNVNYPLTLESGDFKKTVLTTGEAGTTYKYEAGAGLFVEVADNGGVDTIDDLREFNNLGRGGSPYLSETQTQVAGRDALLIVAQNDRDGIYKKAQILLAGDKWVEINFYSAQSSLQKGFLEQVILPTFRIVDNNVSSEPICPAGMKCIPLSSTNVSNKHSVDVSSAAVKSGGSVTYSFNFPSDALSGRFAMSCPAGISAKLNGDDICDESIAMPKTVREYKLQFTNTSDEAKHPVANFYIYRESKPNFAEGVSETVTVKPASSAEANEASIKITLPSRGKQFTPGQRVEVDWTAENIGEADYYSINLSNTNTHGGETGVLLAGNVSIDATGLGHSVILTESVINTVVANTNGKTRESIKDDYFIIITAHKNIGNGYTAQIAEAKSDRFTIKSSSATPTATAISSSQTSYTGGFCHFFGYDLNRGDTGNDVVALHKIMAEAGYGSELTSSRTFPDTYTSSLMDKVKKFQASRGLSQTGTLDDATRGALLSSFGCPSRTTKLTVIGPEGTSVEAGKSVTFQWVSYGIIGVKKIVLVPQQSGRSEVVVMDRTIQQLPIIANSYTWSIPSHVTPGSYKVQVRMGDNGISDTSNKAFTITNSSNSTGTSVSSAEEEPSALTASTIEILQKFFEALGR